MAKRRHTVDKETIRQTLTTWRALRDFMVPEVKLVFKKNDNFGAALEIVTDEKINFEIISGDNTIRISRSFLCLFGQLNPVQING